MDRGWYLRLLLVLGVVALSCYLLYPSYVYFFEFESPADMQDDHDAFCAAMKPLSCAKVNLGLDLQGGVHLVMGVDVEKAVEQRTDRLAESLRDGLKDEEIAFTRIDRPRDNAEIHVELPESTDRAAFEKYLRRAFSVLQVSREKSGVIVLEMAAEEAQRVRENAVEQTIKTIRNRADRLGVTEPTIAKRGTENVLIQLPGVKDPQRAIDLIGKTAQLEFKIVDEEASAVFDEITEEQLKQIEGVEKEETSFQGAGGKSIRDVYFELPNDKAKKEELRTLLEDKLPTTRELAFGLTTLPNGAQNPDRLRTYVLHAQPGITGDYLTDADVQQDQNLGADFYVTMTFDTKGAKIFGDLTEKNVQRHMAIVLDDTVNSAPIIQEKIPGGTARITLGRSGSAQERFQEAKDLSLVLKAGALPAPVEILEQRRIGHTLGKESVDKGLRAIMVGFALVIMFMAFYYRMSGVLADLALVLNVLLVLAILALFEATLTLPGMAGIVLTIGMAVDANVIIFERIREELKIGKTPRAAIESGYTRAFSTILDSNVTTIIAGIVLMEYGSGPVRGFAVTLIIGILSSMFTAIVVTRLVYDFFSSRRRLQSLSI